MHKINFRDDKNYIKIPINRKTIGISLILLLSFTCGFQWFFSRYYIQSPVVLQFRNPIASYGLETVEAEEKEVIISPLPSPSPIVTKEPKKQTKIDYDVVNPPKDIKQQIIAKSKYPDRTFQIWFNETTNGKDSTDPTALHMYCRNKGMTNEFGFMPADKHCFETFEQSVERVNRWFDQEAKGLDIAVAFCWYSGYGKVPKCSYDTSLVNL